MPTATIQGGEFATLLADHNPYNPPKIGETIDGTVVSISKKGVLLDINGLATGIVRGHELYDESGEYSNLKVGDEASATVIDLENEDGHLELSFRYAGHQKAWDNLKKLHGEGKIVEVKVSSCNKGGLMVKLGKITGFLPVSQLSVEHYPRVEGGDKNKILEKLNKIVGKALRVKIIDVDEEEEKLIVSERASQEEEHKDKVSQYKIGDIVEGKITGVVDFGAFIEFGEHLEGLIHISELAWQRIDDPQEIVTVGDHVKAEIISIEENRISLSMKKLKEDPWQAIEKKYKVGDKVKGTVLKLNPFGLFVELDKDIHGLAHISELSEKAIQSPTEVANVGDEIEFCIVSIEPKQHRLGLSIKALNEKPKEKEEEKKEETPQPEESKEETEEKKEDQ